MTSLQWLATEMRTGKVIADLPDLADSQGGDLTVAVQMGDYQTCTASLPLPTAPENWPRATMEGASTLILLQDEVPIWGGWVSQCPRDETDELPLSLITMEGYFDRVYVGDETFVQVGQNDIVVYLIEKYAKDGALAGIPIRVEVVSGGAGELRDKTYLATDRKTLYSVLQDLSGIDGGPEWTVGWEHQVSPERYTPVAFVGDRLGRAVPEGLAPAASFDMPGPVTEFKDLRSYTVGNGATSVVAYSSGQGSAQPQSSLIAVDDPDRPRFEYQWTPSTSIIDPDTLTGYAMSKLDQIKDGTRSISLTAVADEAPRVGVDWGVGDDIGYQIGGYDAEGRDTVPSEPGGLVGIARAIGWTMTTGNTPLITPVLAGAAG